MSRRQAWLLPGRRQTLVVAGLVLLAGVSLLLLPDPSRSYRAVATAVPPSDAPGCVRAARDQVADEAVVERVARGARVARDDVADATDVLPTPPGALLSVAFRADSAYGAQRGAFTTVSESVSTACADDAGALLLDVGASAQRFAAADRALKAAVTPLDPLAPPPPAPPRLVAERDEAAAALRAASDTFNRQSTVPTRSTSVDPAEAVDPGRSGGEGLAVPAGLALAVLLALLVLRTGWRRAAGPVPA
jgi:hypothetical protein